MQRGFCRSSERHVRDRRSPGDDNTRPTRGVPTLRDFNVPFPDRAERLKPWAAGSRAAESGATGKSDTVKSGATRNKTANQKNDDKDAEEDLFANFTVNTPDNLPITHPFIEDEGT